MAPREARERTGHGSLHALVERDDELVVLHETLSAASAGDGRLVLVEAQAGLGKSALLASAAELAADHGLTALSAAGATLEQDHAFGLALQMLGPVVQAADADDRADLLGGAAALARPLFEDQAPTAATPEEHVFSLLHGLHWLTANIAARRPMLIAADDLHWADRPSLRFLLYLAQRLADLPIALVVTARPAEPGAPADLLRQLRTHSLTRVLRPRPLSRAAVVSLVGRRLPDAEPEFADACWDVTEGNAYLLSELLADLVDRGVAPTAANAGDVGRLAPPSVLDAALMRLARLPAGSVELARAAAVLGDDATPRLVAALAGVDAGEAVTASDALAAAEILRPGEPLRFVHPLLHSAIYSAVPPSQCADSHRRAAQLLDGDDLPVETVASHLLLASAAADPWAVDSLRAAARRASAQGAPESAVRYLSRALEEPPTPAARARVLVELGEAEALTGQGDAVGRMNRALDLIDAPVDRARVLERLGWTLQKSGDMVGAVDAFGRGVEELETAAGGAEHDEQLTNLRVAHLGAALLEPGAAEHAHARIQPLVQKEALELTSSERGLLSVAAMHLLFSGDAHDRVIDMARRVWGDGALIEQAGSNSPVVWHVIGSLSWSDELDEAEAVIEATLTAARKEGSILTLALGFYSRAWPRYWKGDIHGAAADAKAAMDAWSGEFSMYLPVAGYWRAMALLELDDHTGAAAALALERAKERWGGSNMYGALLAARGLVQLKAGDAAGAILDLEESGEAVLGSLVANPAVFPWRSYLALSLLAAGRRDEARAIAREELDLSRRYGAARPIGIALRSTGLTEGGAAGVELLEQSVAILRTSPSRLELARALVSLGGAQRRQGHRAAARETLGEGLDMAREFGALALEREAEGELRAAGARPRRRDRSGVDALTPSELRVAEMAAAGMTNREIAQSLFVTVKAVQFHLGNTYRKLGVASREQLPEGLSRN